MCAVLLAPRSSCCQPCCAEWLGPCMLAAARTSQEPTSDDCMEPTQEANAEKFFKDRLAPKLEQANANYVNTAATPVPCMPAVKYKC